MLAAVYMDDLKNTIHKIKLYEKTSCCHDRYASRPPGCYKCRHPVPQANRTPHAVNQESDNGYDTKGSFSGSESESSETITAQTGKEYPVTYLRKKLKRAAKEKDGLLHDLEHLKTEVKRLSYKVESHGNENKCLKKRLAESEQCLEENENEVIHMQDELEQFFTSQQAMGKEMKRLQKEINYLRRSESRDSRLAAENHELLSCIHKLRQQEQGNSDKIQNLEEENQRLAKLYDDNLVRLKRQIKHMDSRSKRHKRISPEKYDSLKDRYRKAKQRYGTETRSLKHDISELQSKIQKLQEQEDTTRDLRIPRLILNNTQSDKLPDTTRSNPNATGIKSFEEQMQEFEDEVIKPSTELEHSRQKYCELEQEYLKLQNTFNALEIEKEALTKLEIEYKISIDELETELKISKQREDNLVEENDALKAAHKSGNLTEREKTLNTVASQLKQRILELERINEDLSRKYAQIKDNITEKANPKSPNDSLTRKNETSHEVRRLEKEVAELTDALATERSNFKKQTYRNRSDYEENVKSVTSYYKTRLQTLESSYNDLEEERVTLKKALKRMEGNEKKKDIQIDELEEELDDAKTRLSKLMSSKLTDNNPNITDLRDGNRPTKLAERYTELYDNQWTDAFDVIDGGDENTTIEALLAILRDVMSYCQTNAEDQMKDLKSILLMNTSTDNKTTLNTVAFKQLKECRKASGPETGKHIFKTYLSNLNKADPSLYKIAAAIPEYVEECCELCWLMCIQDPPVVIGTSVKQGQTFDTSLHRAYTVNGAVVEFEVWPPLFLHQGGPILCKGVAQGMI